MRSPPFVRSSNACARRLAGLLVACVAMASPRGVSGAPREEKVRITYHALQGCPAEDVFLSAVRARIGTDWEAAPAAPARAMDVTIDMDEERSIARLTFVDDEGRAASRTVSGATCAEAVTGIALATALAIESRVDAAKDASQTSPPSVAAAPASADPAASPAVATALPASPALRQPAPAPRAASGASPRSPWRAELGAAAVVTSGVGPAPAFGARLLGGIEWPHGADLRLGIDYAATAPTLVQKYGGVKVQTYELGARVSGCPFAFALGARVRVRPCAGIAAGIIHAETRASAGVSVTGSGNPAFVAPFAELRLDLELGAVFVEAGGEVRFVVDNPTFALDAPDDRPSLYPVPLVAVGASLGLGLRL